MNDKIIAFEYIVSQLIIWLRELTNCSEEQALQEFNKLKLFKLHFFVSAISTELDTENDDLLKTFNNFCALPYGPVESDVYNHLNETLYYTISNEGILKKSNNDINLNRDSRDLIDSSIELLSKENNEIVTYSAFDLVELSHQWPVWRILYSRALSQGKRSIEMPSSLIRASSKKFK